MQHNIATIPIIAPNIGVFDIVSSMNDTLFPESDSDSFPFVYVVVEFAVTSVTFGVFEGDCSKSVVVITIGIGDSVGAFELG